MAFVNKLRRFFRYGDNQLIAKGHGKEVVASRLMAQLRRRLHLTGPDWLEIIIN